MLAKILSVLDKVLTAILTLVCVVVLYFVIDANFIHPGYKGISQRDLADLSVVFCIIFLVKIVIKLGLRVAK